MSYEDYVSQGAERMGCRYSDAERAVATVIEVLGQRLSKADAAVVGAQLPKAIGEQLVSAQYEGGFDLFEFERRVSAVDCERLRTSRAVCQLVAETLDEQGRAQLRMQPLSSLFC